MITMEQEIWFSHRESIYEVKNGEFRWTDKKKIWNWDHCTISFARSYKNNQLIGVVRSSSNTNSKYMGDIPVNVRYMLGFAIKNVVSEPEVERANEWGGPGDRLILQLGPNHWIWDWTEERDNTKKSYIYELYEYINKELANQTIERDNLFKVDVETKMDIVPVIYQPAVDSLKNFVREIHCAKPEKRKDGSYEIEVTLVFNNEQLRKHSYSGILNQIYEKIRNELHGRILDVESFKMIIKPKVDDISDIADISLIFKDIYSDYPNECHNLEDDNIHCDVNNAPQRSVAYYFKDKKHPVIFVNTSNHAMAEDDNNLRLWKWEYIPWVSDAPVKFGRESRTSIDERFMTLMQRYFSFLITK